MTNYTLEERVTALESTAYRQGQHLGRLDGAVTQINGKLDDLSQQVREVRSVQTEHTHWMVGLDGRMEALEARVEQVEGRLGRVEHRLGDIQGRLDELTDLVRVLVQRSGPVPE